MRKQWAADFPTMTVPTEETGVPNVALGLHGSSPKPKAHLPWHHPHVHLLEKHQEILEGTATSSSGTSHKPLDQGGFFRRASVKDEHYHICGEPDTEGVQLPENFSSIQAAGDLKPRKRSKTKPALEVPMHMARDMETQLRRSLRIQSYQEWFLGTARDLIEGDPKSSESTPPDLDAIIPLLVSSGRALQDSNLISHQLLFNLLLLRRDSFIDTLARDVPQEFTQRLRRHPLSDTRHLFDKDVVESARQATLEARQAAVVTAAAAAAARNRNGRSNNNNNNRNNNSGRGQRSPAQGSPTQFTRGSPKGNNRGGQWQKGKRSPKFKGSPYQKKGGKDNDK